MVDSGEGSILEQRPSLDGTSIYYVIRPTIPDNAGLVTHTAEIRRYDLDTGESETILAKEGVSYLGPIELPGGYLAFTSNERLPQRSVFDHDMQSLYISKLDGSEAMLVSEHQLASVLTPEYDPVPETKQVHLLTSTHETQARRRGLLWGVWTHTPDFSEWGPAFSAFIKAKTLHFHGAGRDADNQLWRFTIGYYPNGNNDGFGRLYIAPRHKPGAPDFEHVTNPSHNGEMVFVPKGRVIPAAWAHGSDNAAGTVTGQDELRVGKLNHPAATPDGRLLIVWGPGPVNNLNRPTPLPRVRAGIYLMPLGPEIPEPTIVDGEVVPQGMELIVNTAEYNEYMPRAVVSFEDLYGFVPEPYQLQHETELIPKGSPYGIMGGGWISRQEARPLTWTGGDTSTSVTQGYSVPHDDSEVEYLEFYQMEISPNPTRTEEFNPKVESTDQFGEYYRTLGRIPAKTPDGSAVKRWAVKLPADVPIGMATLDEKDRVLAWSATWKKVEAGAVYDKGCVGCHVHASPKIDPLLMSIDLPLPDDIPLSGGRPKSEHWLTIGASTTKGGPDLQQLRCRVSVK